MSYNFFVSSLGYRLFMMALQQQIAILDKFVIQQESIPNFILPLPPNLNILKTSDKNELTKNVSLVFYYLFFILFY